MRHRLRYDETTASFLDIKAEDMVKTSHGVVHVCPLCVRAEKLNDTAAKRRNIHNNSSELELNNSRIHAYDFVMFIPEGDPQHPGPCDMGQILAFGESRRRNRPRVYEIIVTVRLIGRLTDVVDAEELGYGKQFRVCTFSEIVFLVPNVFHLGSSIVPDR